MGKQLHNTIKKIALFDIDYTLFDTDQFRSSNLTNHSLYKEVQNALNNLKDTVVLGIFSEGELKIQTEKLHKTGIGKYFTIGHIHIVEDKLLEIERILKQYKGKKLFLVDDKLEMLYSAKQFEPAVVTLWVKRGKYALAQKPIEGFQPDAIIESLDDAVSIIGSFE